MTIKPPEPLSVKLWHTVIGSDGSRTLVEYPEPLCTTEAAIASREPMPLDEIKQFLIACKDDSMSRNNRLNLAAELLSAFME